MAAMGHFIAEREKLHSNLLGLHVQSGSWVTDGTLHRLAAGLSAKSSGLTAATGRAAEIIDGKLRLQAYSLTFIDAFYLVAWACAGMLLLTAILRKAPLSFAELSPAAAGIHFDPKEKIVKLLRTLIAAALFIGSALVQGQQTESTAPRNDQSPSKPSSWR